MLCMTAYSDARSPEAPGQSRRLAGSRPGRRWFGQTVVALDASNASRPGSPALRRMAASRRLQGAVRGVLRPIRLSWLVSHE